MSYTRSLHMTALLSALAVVTVCCPSTFANMRATADGTLARLGLDKDEEALLGYLTVGLPADVQKERWRAYEWGVIVKLGELKSQRAIPLLRERIRTPLPDVPERDLYMYVGDNGFLFTWEEWDIRFQSELALFRAQCAMALARIGDEESLPVLREYLASLRTDVADGLATFREDPTRRANYSSHLPFAFGTVCRAITALGGKEGIDALVGTLDVVLTTISPEQIVHNLRLCTGQPFGPEDSQPLHMRQTEIRKWKQWWEQHRDTFQGDRERILNTHVLDIRTPAPTTVYEYVKAAETRGGDFDGTGHGAAAVQWLEANGGAHVEEFETIVNDEQEDTAVRGEALKWYVRFNGANAFDLLRGYAEDDTRYTDLGGGEMYLQSASLKAITEHFPDKAQEVARKCMLSKHDMVALTAINTLMTEPAGQAYVAQNYGKLRWLDTRMSAVSQLLRLADPTGRPAFFEALKDEDAWIASYAARGIRKFDLESELPPDSRQALAQWRQDPEFLVLMIDRSEPVEVKISQAREALALIRTPDAYAARVYLWTPVSILPAELQNEVHAGLDNCIAAFKAWQATRGPG